MAAEIAQELEALAVADVRSKRMRGCTYRSRFFAGMYSDPALLSYLSDLAQADLRPHPIGHHRVQLNFVPEDRGRAVDVWHYDVVSFDIVMLLTEPSLMKGGNTEYFWGTVEEGEAILRQGVASPLSESCRWRTPAPGGASCSRAIRCCTGRRLSDEPYPRISLVASYYCADSRFREPTILPPLRVTDGRDVALLEWANYAAYRTVAKLQRFLEDQPDFGLEPAEVRDRLQECIAEAEVAIAEFDSLDEGHLINLG